VLRTKEGTVARHSKKQINEAQNPPRNCIDTVRYLGCMVTVRISAVKNGSVRGFYEISPVASETIAVFERRGFGPIASEVMEVESVDYLVEMAKCNIDFLLEKHFDPA
jgi:hypothetical protein